MFRNRDGERFLSLHMIKIHVVDDAETYVQGPLVTRDGLRKTFWTKAAGLQETIDSLPFSSPLPFYECIEIEVHAGVPVIDIALSEKVLCLRGNAGEYGAVNIVPVHVSITMSKSSIDFESCTLSPTSKICGRQVGMQSLAALARQLHRDGVCRCARPHTFSLNGVGRANIVPRASIPVAAPRAPPPDYRPRARSRGPEPLPDAPSPPPHIRPRARSTSGLAPGYNGGSQNRNFRVSYSRETAEGPVHQPVPHQYLRGQKFSRSQYPGPEDVPVFNPPDDSFHCSRPERSRGFSGPVHVPRYASGDGDEDWEFDGIKVVPFQDDNYYKSRDNYYDNHDRRFNRRQRRHSIASSSSSASSASSASITTSDSEPAPAPRHRAGRDEDEGRNSGRGRSSDAQDHSQNGINDGHDRRRNRSRDRDSRASSAPEPQRAGRDGDDGSNAGHGRPSDGGLHVNWHPREPSRAPSSRSHSPLPSFKVFPPSSTSPSTVVSSAQSSPGVQIIFVNSPPSTPGTPESKPAVYINPVMCSHHHDDPPSPQGYLDR